MRLWSLHPKHLDSRGLVALWREALLAQAVLAGKTRGYKHHPQLVRFLKSPSPRKCIAAYLRPIHDEALRRGYHFDEKKIGNTILVTPLPVTTGQLDFEWSHLLAKLKARTPDWFKKFEAIGQPVSHPLFHVTQGGIASWEVVTT